MEHETGTHTAGPWTVDAWGDDECDVYGPVDQLICSLSQKYCEDTGQGLNQNIEHDAALIAAAPDMLSTLRRAKDELIELYEHLYADDESDNETTEVIDRVIAVIAQAEGRHTGD
jgi:hypothetical protein